MSWIFLGIAVLADVAATATLQRAVRGRSRRYLPLTAATYLLALFAFAQALRTIPTGVADAIYYAGATAALAVIGVLWLGDTVTARKTTALILVVIGVIVLRLQTPS